MRLYYILAAAYLLFVAIGFFQMRFLPSGGSVEISSAPAPSGNKFVWDGKKEGKRLFKWSLLALLFAILGLFPLMGMPGLLVVGFYEITGILSGAMEGDRMWPAAIIGAMLWPLGIPIGILAQQLGMRFQVGFLALYGAPLGLIVWIVAAGFILRGSALN